MSISELTTRSSTTIPFYRDVRTLAVLAQAAFLLAIVITGYYLVSNVTAGLRASNIPLGWGFLRQEAGFAISEGPLFDPAESYARAFVVGAINTVRVAISGIILATVFGLLVGIARLSSNWLLRSLATGYVEVVRNTPLLVQLVFWYFAVILKLPDIGNSQNLGDGLLFASNRGLSLTWPRISPSGQALIFWAVGALVAAVVIGLVYRRIRVQQGRIESGLAPALIALLIVLATGYAITALTASLPEEVAYTLQRGDRGMIFHDRNGDGLFSPELDQPLRYMPVTLLAADSSRLGAALTDSGGAFRFFDLPQEGAALAWNTPSPIVWDEPVLQGFNYRGGQLLSPEFAALLLGLIVYTAAFIAEIVRGGMNAVPKGQWEASRALGLSGGQTLRLVILPQALRIIIPPLTNQYLNLTKNSSLAIAVGYPDLFNVSRTIFNQSGATVQMFILIMATYLALSLLTSAFMNWYNRRMALVER
jgi:general L-amino acid transport system permease protein